MDEPPEAVHDFEGALMGGGGGGDGGGGRGSIDSIDSADDVLNTPVVPDAWQPIKVRCSTNVSTVRLTTRYRHLLHC